MARTKSAVQRRSDLLDAAEELVLQGGIESFTIDEVTLGAGVAKGTFYLHFSHKNDLIASLRDRYVQRFVDRQQTAARGGDGVGRVRRWMLAGIDEYLRDVRLHDVLFHYVARSEQPARNLAVEALRELIEETGIDVPDPEAAALVIYHAMHGIADHVLHFPDERQRMLDEASRLCRALLAAPAVPVGGA